MSIKLSFILCVALGSVQGFAGDESSDDSSSDSDSEYKDQLEKMRQRLHQETGELELVLGELGEMGIDDYCDLLIALGISETSAEDQKVMDAEKKLKRNKKKDKKLKAKKSKTEDDKYLKPKKKAVDFKGDPNKANNASKEQLERYNEMLSIFKTLNKKLGDSDNRIQRESYAATLQLLGQLRLLHENFRAICEELAEGNTRDSRILGRDFPTLHPDYEYGPGEPFERLADYFFEIVSEAVRFAEEHDLLPELARSIETATGCFDDRIRNVYEWLARERSRLDRATPNPEQQVTDWYISIFNEIDGIEDENLLAKRGLMKPLRLLTPCSMQAAFRGSFSS